MAKTVALVGKQGPIFGDGRPSHTEIEFLTFEDSPHWSRVGNWPRNDRADALRALFDNAAETVEYHGDFAGRDAG